MNMYIYLNIHMYVCIRQRAVSQGKMFSKFRKNTFSKVSIMVYRFFVNLAVRSLLRRVHVSDTVSRLLFI